MVEEVSCLLCMQPHVQGVFAATGRKFYECSRCDLLFVSPLQFLALADEKLRYQSHHNDDSNSGYRAFISKLKDALIPNLKPGMHGLDFGSGSCDLLARLFSDHGYTMHLYDPLFGPGLIEPTRSYDFIACCEVVEHFREPLNEFKRMFDLLTPGGWLGIMTAQRDSHRSDQSWWYLRDATHLCFYSRQTFGWIAKTIGFDIEFKDEAVVLLRKKVLP